MEEQQTRQVADAGTRRPCMQNTAPKKVELPALLLDDQDHGAKDGRPAGARLRSTTRIVALKMITWKAWERDDLSSPELDDQDNGAEDGRPADARPS